jgi:hypothetical protein
LTTLLGAKGIPLVLAHQSKNLNKVAYALGNQAVLLNVIRTHEMVPIPSKSYTKEFYPLNTFIRS